MARKPQSEPTTPAEPATLADAVLAEKAAMNTDIDLPSMPLTELPPPVAFDPFNPEVYVHRYVPTDVEGEVIAPGVRRINY